MIAGAVLLSMHSQGLPGEEDCGEGDRQPSQSLFSLCKSLVFAGRIRCSRYSSLPTPCCDGRSRGTPWTWRNCASASSTITRLRTHPRNPSNLTITIAHHPHRSQEIPSRNKALSAPQLMVGGGGGADNSMHSLMAADPRMMNNDPSRYPGMVASSRCGVHVWIYTSAWRPAMALTINASQAPEPPHRAAFRIRGRPLNVHTREKVS